jgi:hypothetical protein
MANPVNLSELNKALDDLIMQDAPPVLEDTDLTVQRLAARAKCGSVKAKRLLADWTEAGKVEYLGKRRNTQGHNVDGWRLKV